MITISERYLGQIRADMDVCDVNGDKIGTVADVYRHEFIPASVGEAAAPEREDVVEVKTGFLRLGKRLYIPTSAIMDVTLGCLFIAKPREEIDSTGWNEKPSYVP